MARTGITGKAVLITGASAGIGAALAQEFAHRGAEVFLMARRADRLQALVERILAAGGRAHALPGDVVREQDLAAAMAAVAARGVTLDVIVANAGFGVSGRFTELSLADYQRQFEVNVFGVLRTVQAGLAHLRRSRGRIVILGSVAGHVSLPGGSAYSMSKFAVRALAAALHGELRAEGVGVTLISPGFVDSDIRRTDNLGRLHGDAPDPIPGWLRMPVARAARAIVDATERGDRECVVTVHGKIIVWLSRCLPWAIGGLVRHFGEGALRRGAARGGAMRDFHLPGRSPVYATEGMAATSMPLASLTALDTLRAGGNALDAAVAAVALLGVIEPQSTGIGGDCFCLYKPAGGKVAALNGSGCAPAAASLERLAELGVHELEATSAHSVTVPGAVAAWELLLAIHGRKGLDELLQPAIHHAERGFVVAPRVAFDWAAEATKLARQGAHGFLPGGVTPRAGQVIRQPELARTLRRIAAAGARAFYEGEIAGRMVGSLRSLGGLHTEEDFAAMRTAVEFVTPISARWRDVEVWQCPPNGSGLMVLMMLGILGGLPTSADPLGALRLHRHAEAARLVFRDRDAFIADPAATESVVERLLDAPYLAGLRAQIDDSRTLPRLPQPGQIELPRHSDTVYVSVVDRDGNACSLINSIFQSFGSGIVSAEDGIVLHNRGFGFTLRPGHPNALAPRKRPMHTILPGLLTRRGRAVMPFGVMGSHYQPIGQSWLLTNFLEYGMDLQQAVDFPRVLPSDGKWQVERGVGPATRAGLAALGHTLIVPDEPLGGAQAVWMDHERGVLVGASDPRKDGCALGY